MKKFLLIIVFTLFVINNFTYAHVEHYKNIKFLKYGLYLNNKLIGSHNFSFKRDKDLFKVTSEGNFTVNKLGVKLMDYKTSTLETYDNGKLINYDSKTTQNDKKKFARVIMSDKNKLIIDGSSYRGETDPSIMIGSWWNHEIVKNSKQISPISGRIIEQKVKFIGKESISINGNSYSALHFHFFSNDNEPMNKKKLNIHVWYDSKSLLWIKSRYEKFGTWEYRLNQAG